MSKEKTVKEIDVESLDAELAAAKKIEEQKNTVFGKIAAVFAFAMSVYQIYIVFGHLAVISMRAIHVAFGFTVLILALPLYEHVFKDKFAKNQAFRLICRIIDMVLIVALWWSVYLVSNEYAHLSDNNGKAGTMAFVAGLIFLVIVLDGARRSLGWIMPILAIIFLLYARFGGYIQGSLGHRGYSWDNLMKYLAVDLDGIFGTTIQVSTTVIYMFVMFGAFLDISGCSNFINDLALSVTGKLRCGKCGASMKRVRQSTADGVIFHWSCTRHLRDREACSMKRIKEDTVKNSFITLVNKLCFLNCGNTQDSVIPGLHPLEDFDEGLFENAVLSADVMTDEKIVFHLSGGLKLTERIVPERMNRKQ